MDKLNKLAEKHGKTLTGMIDSYAALGMMFEDLLKDDGEIVIVKKKDVDKIADKTLVPFRYLNEAG